jgi:signal transduction histidine kinase
VDGLPNWLTKHFENFKLKPDEYLSVAIALFTAFALVMGTAFVNRNTDSNSTIHGTEIIDAWTLSDSGKTLHIYSNTDLQRFGKQTAQWRDHGVIEVSADIPISDYAQPGLYLDGVDERFEVFQGSELIYSFGMDLPKSGIPGVKTHVIPLKDETDDEEDKNGVTRIRVRIHSASAVVGFYGVQAYGNVDALRVFSVRHHFGQLAVAVICLFSFASFLGAAIWTRVQRNAYMLYSALCLIAAGYFLGQSRFGLIFVDQPLSAIIANRGFVLLLTIVFLAFFEYSVCQSPRPAVRNIIKLLSAAAILTVFASAYDHSLINKVIRPWQFVALGVQIYILAMSFVERQSQSSSEGKALLTGVSIAVVTGFHDYLMSMGIVSNKGVGIGHWGAFALIVCFGWMLIYRAKIAQTAMEQFTRNLQEKVAERTMDLQKTIQSLEGEMKARANLEVLARNSARQAAVADLSRGLAHEINNPLTILNGYAHVIKSSLEQEEPGKQSALVLKSAGEILNMSNRISRVVKGLLEFSEGSDDGNFESVSALDLCESISIIIAPMAKSKDINFEIQFLNDNVRTQEVKCRPIQIKQILVNLISNAIDAYARITAGRDIELMVDQMGEWVTFTVVDHAHGIPKAIRTRIFEPFVSTKTDSNGTGLGLSVSHGLARANGGRLSFVSVESDDITKRGTRFTLALPIPQTSQKSA